MTDRPGDIEFAKKIVDNFPISLDPCMDGVTIHSIVIIYKHFVILTPAKQFTIVYNYFCHLILYISLGLKPIFERPLESQVSYMSQDRRAVRENLATHLLPPATECVIL